jgi:hypothetical protein
MEVTGQQVWAVVRPVALRRGPCKVLKRLIDDDAAIDVGRRSRVFIDSRIAGRLNAIRSYVRLG